MWSRDGQTIVLGFGTFNSANSGGSTLGTIAVTSGESPVVPMNTTLDGKCQLTDGPALAPDGSFMIAIRNNCLSQPDDGLWAYNLDGTGGQQVSHAELAITHPVVLDSTHALAVGALDNSSDQGLVVFTLGAAPQVLPPPTGLTMNDLAISADQSTIVVAMTDKTTFLTNLFVTTDLKTYTPLTQTGHVHGPAF
jgi:hypothetical protein